MRLRDYQVECLQRIANERVAGVKRQLVVLPTGSGKTIVFANMMHHAKGKKTLVLAHREELLTQAVSKIMHANPGLHVSIEQADQVASRLSDVVVASVPTIGRKDSPRLRRLRPGDVGLVIVDEAHHSVALTYKNVFDHFGILDGAPAAPLTVGFTATPDRGDSVGLSAVYQKVVYQKTIVDMIQDGYLVPIRAWRVSTEADLSGVHSRAGDFIESELSEAVNNPKRNELIVQCYRDKGHGKPCIVFCVDLEHARGVLKAFHTWGLAAEGVSGKTEKEERRAILRRFAAGETKILVNCMVLTEGFDCPPVETIIMARPTKSRGLYQQCIGRGTRLSPQTGKEYLSIIDLADVTNHKLASTAEIFGLAPNWESQGEDLLKRAKEVEGLCIEVPHVKNAVTIEQARSMMREIDLMADARVRQDIRHASSMSWIQLPNERMLLHLPDGRMITADGDLLDNWTVRLTDARGSGGIIGDTASCSDTWPSREEAVWAADRFVRVQYPEAVRVLDLAQPWRKTPASDQQRSLLLKLGAQGLKPSLTKGEASDMITILRGRKAQKAS